MLAKCTGDSIIYFEKVCGKSDPAVITGCVNTLMRLQGESHDILERTCLVIAYLLDDDLRDQGIARDCGIHRFLHDLLLEADGVTGGKDTRPTVSTTTSRKSGSATTLYGPVDAAALEKQLATAPSREKLKEAVLLAIAASCSKDDQSRRMVSDAKMIPRIVAALDHPAGAVRLAACRCIHSLGRRVANLRTSLFETDVLVKMVRVRAVAARCTHRAALGRCTSDDCGSRLRRNHQPRPQVLQHEGRGAAVWRPGEAGGAGAQRQRINPLKRTVGPETRRV